MNQSNSSNMTCGGVILCGGQSTRMGRPKLALPFGNECMLARVARILDEEVSPVHVVAANGQEIPDVAVPIQIARDEFEDYGPLGGLYTGLKSLAVLADAAFVSAVDAPLLRGDFVRTMIAELGDADMVICRGEKYHYPLAAVYRTSLWETVAQMIDDGQRRPTRLIDNCTANVIDVHKLRDVDPDLDSLRNTNTPADYSAALARAGFDSTELG